MTSEVHSRYTLSPQRKRKPRNALLAEQKCLTDRWGPPVGFVFYPRARLDRDRGEAPAMIAGAWRRRSRRSAHLRAQEDGPHTLEGKGVTGEAQAEQGFSHGGGGRRVEEGFRPGACSGAIEVGDGFVGSRVS